MSATIESQVYTAFDAAAVVQKQRDFFATGKTKDVEFRISTLKKLRQLIVDNESSILDALKKDLNKPELEAYTTEVGFVLKDIDHTLKAIRKWAKPEKVATPLFHQLGTSWIQSEPLGVTYVIAPWNYPFQLALSPVIGAMAAGNTCLIRPSRMSENTAKIMEKIINENFDEGYLKVVISDMAQSNALLEQKFDYIFFTGSPDVGRQIYQAAAKHLTPVTLELGGKSPCFVDENFNENWGIKRLVWGKFTNAGQTCVAPDYILVDKKAKQRFVELFIKTTGIKERRIAGEDMSTSDLCYEPAKQLIEKLQWDKEDIDVVIMVTQSPDYFIPGSAIILQHKLGLKKSCLAFGQARWLRFHLFVQ